jgi:5' nucleotidase, deoxy (Pyrimidine), cytosolic type C protein (NT5C)
MARIARTAEPADSPSPPEFVFAVDLDGVCADFYGELRNIAAEWLGCSPDQLTPEVTYGLPEWDLDPLGGYVPLHRFAVTQRRLFAEAPPIVGAAPALRRLSQLGVRIRIITNRLFIPYFHQEAVKQTIAWLDHHAFPYSDLCLMKDKAAVGADLYVDDSPDNVKALRAKGLPTIVFTNSTNREVEGPRADTWEEVEEIVLEHLDRWHESSEAAGDGPAGR